MPGRRKRGQQSPTVTGAANAVLAVREALGVSQEDMATRLRTSVAVVRRCEDEARLPQRVQARAWLFILSRQVQVVIDAGKCFGEWTVQPAALFARLPVRSWPRKDIRVERVDWPASEHNYRVLVDFLMNAAFPGIEMDWTRAVMPVAYSQPTTTMTSTTVDDSDILHEITDTLQDLCDALTKWPPSDVFGEFPHWAVDEQGREIWQPESGVKAALEKH